jgi:general L-amino acid transport system permease protein
MAALDTTQSAGPSSWFQDERYRSLFYQLLTLVGFVGFFWFILHNTVENMAAKNLSLGIDFLESIAGFDISFKLDEFSLSTSNYWRVFYIGLLNTLFVSALGVVCATLVGFTFGVLRLSPNWIVSRLVYAYVEFVRNVPLLLQIFIWAAVFLYLPQIRDAYTIGDAVFLSNRGLEMPLPITGDSFIFTVIALIIGLVASFIVRRWAKARQAATGQFFPAGWASLGLIVVFPLLVFLVTGMPLEFQLPEIKGFNFQGGINVPPSFMALWLALSLYTAAFISEIVRAGIQSVSHGQTEAAYAVGLRPGRTLRLVIIPQALRVIVPPLTSQYLNLTKNSSLGVAIAYPELVSVFAGTTLNQTGHAVEVLAITMLVYLTISLSISMLMNWYNRSIALVER